LFYPRPVNILRLPLDLPAAVNADRAAFFGENIAMSNIPHGMPCPVCNIPLAMSDRQGVEIDYCPQCRGVWLDRGELDKIIERSTRDLASAPPPPSRQPAAPDYGQAHGHYKQGHPKRRKSFLEELFD
jgi:Zn-finger nucleic acid-binding protein